MDLCKIFSKSLTIIISKTYVRNSNNGLAEHAKGLEKITVASVYFPRNRLDIGHLLLCLLNIVYNFLNRYLAKTMSAGGVYNVTCAYLLCSSRTLVNLFYQWIGASPSCGRLGCNDLGALEAGRDSLVVRWV